MGLNPIQKVDSAEEVQDEIAATVAAAGNISVSYDDPNDTLTIDTSALNEEEVEDAVSALLQVGANLTLNYDDPNDTLTIGLDTHAATHESGGSDTVNHDNLTGFVADEHVDHSTTNITAGNGLVGGGDLTQSRTLDAHSVTTETGAYTANENDVVLADASGGAFTVTLPSPSTDIAVTVKKIDGTSNAVTIATPGSETIDGSSDRTLTGQYVSRTVISDGSEYYII
jgi:hypothetical protein